MNENRFPDFGQELKRPFEVCSRCYDCVEFYGEGHGSTGCDAWPADRPFRCADYYPLPPVGINGETGQHFPPSRMKGRKEPRERKADAGKAQSQPKQRSTGKRQKYMREYMRQYMKQRRAAS